MRIFAAYLGKMLHILPHFWLASFPHISKKKSCYKLASLHWYGTYTDCANTNQLNAVLVTVVYCSSKALCYLQPKNLHIKYLLENLLNVYSQWENGTLNA